MATSGLKVSDPMERVIISESTVDCLLLLHFGKKPTSMRLQSLGEMAKPNPNKPPTKVSQNQRGDWELIDLKNRQRQVPEGFQKPGTNASPEDSPMSYG